MQVFNTIIQYMHALNTKVLKAGSMYALNRKVACNNGVRLTTRDYGMVVKEE